jgi:hypothetical protein
VQPQVQRSRFSIALDREIVVPVGRRRLRAAGGAGITQGAGGAGAGQGTRLLRGGEAGRAEQRAAGHHQKSPPCRPVRRCHDGSPAPTSVTP